jgi:hypothetical protein
MNTLVLEHESLATGVTFAADSFSVSLNDGRCLAIPLAWFPRLLDGSIREREKYSLLGGGEGVHWPDLDEDISVEDLLSGRGSCESQTSLGKWLSARHRSKALTPRAATGRR